MFEKQVKIGYLLDFYGSLLTERRRAVLDMYYNDDMSLSEISLLLGITRQGVRDLIRKSGDELLLLEEKLGAAEKFNVIDRCASRAAELLDDNTGDHREELKKLVGEIRQSIGS